MSKISDIPPTFLESLANELISKYRRLDTILTHALTKGSYHEKILRDFIRNYLPTSFSTGEGFIINKNNEVSSQLDILIVDNLDPRSFGFKENDFYVASDIAVTTIGEVKTYCSRSEFIDAFRKIMKAKSIISEPIARVTSFIFCYDVQASANTFKGWTDYAISKLDEKDITTPWHFPDYIFCLKKKVMMVRNTTATTVQYFETTSIDPNSNLMHQKIVQDLIQCINDGCYRTRKIQGIKAIDDVLK